MIDGRRLSSSCVRLEVALLSLNIPGTTGFFILACRLSDTTGPSDLISINIATEPTLKKKQSWQTLQETAERLQEASTESNALAIASVFGALSLMKEGTNGIHDRR
jgi:hypothetical protein